MWVDLMDLPCFGVSDMLVGNKLKPEVGIPDTPKQDKSIKSIHINSLNPLYCYIFVITLYIDLLHTFELHIKPLPQFYQKYRLFHTTTHYFI